MIKILKEGSKVNVEGVEGTFTLVSGNGGFLIGVKRTVDGEEVHSLVPYHSVKPA